MTKEPLVSIGIPVYNAEKYIYCAITSALVQTYKNTEVIVIDDASTDETANVCKSFGNEIRYFRNKQNMGIGYGRWRIAKEARGDYIAFCSADDVLSNDFVLKLLEEAKKSQGKIIYCGFLTMNAIGNVIDKFEPKQFDNHDDFCVSCLESAMRNTMFVNFSCLLIPREVFKKVNFDKDIRFGEDLDFLLKSMKHFQYKLVPLPLVKYRNHENMVTEKKWNKIDENASRIVKNCLNWWGGIK